MTISHLDLFSGIGGFALAVDAVWPNANHIFCEIDPFCQTILKKHWPQSYIYEDIRTLTNASSQRARMEESDTSRQERKDTNTPQSTLVRQGNWTGNAKGFATGIDLLTGGFPCQPFSHAGKRKGTTDDRHLWPEMRRVIQEFSPRFVVAENVRGLLSIDGGLVFEQVCLDLEALGYEVQPFVIPACAVNAPHRRDRVWFVGHAKHDGLDGSQDRKGCVTGGDRNSKRTDKLRQPKRPALAWEAATDATSQQAHPTEPSRLHAKPCLSDWSEDWPEVATRLCPLDDGLSGGLARPYGWRNAALKAAGNAIVPQVAIELFKALKID